MYKFNISFLHRFISRSFIRLQSLFNKSGLIFPSPSLCHRSNLTSDSNVCKAEPRSLFYVACENIRFSSLFAAGDVSRGGTSVTQRQKFHTDDVKSVRNLVRSADWLTE